MKLGRIGSLAWRTEETQVRGFVRARSDNICRGTFRNACHFCRGGSSFLQTAVGILKGLLKQGTPSHEEAPTDNFFCLPQTLGITEVSILEDDC